MGTIRGIQWGMGYVPAHTRTACRNCAHGQRKEMHTWWWCNKGGFMTAAYSVCEQHATSPSPQPSPSRGEGENQGDNHAPR